MTVHEIRSITQVGTSEPFELQISRGQIPGHYRVQKFGFNPLINQTEETVWSEGGIYYHPPGATQLQVASTSDDDTGNEGDGARSIELQGLDENYNEITETVLLDGTTPVSTTKSFLRINRGFVKTAGDNEVATGIIRAGTGTVTNGVPASVYLRIDPADGQTLMCVWTVPAGYTGYVLQKDVTCLTEANNKFGTIRLITKQPGGVFRTHDKFSVQNDHVGLTYSTPLPLPEKTDIEVRAVGSSSNSALHVSATLEIVYIKNDSRL